MSTNFVNSVKSYIEACGAEKVYNADESVFKWELHSGRTLSYVGGKAVACTMHSVSTTTHSYTILPISCRKTCITMTYYIILIEAGSTFGSKVHENLFQVSIVTLT